MTSPAEQTASYCSPGRNHRILIVDDHPTIHGDFTKVLNAADDTGDMDASEIALFGEALPAYSTAYELDSAYQGMEGLQKVRKSLDEGRPYAVAFVDMRMPPGWDGLETVWRIWEADPDIQIVICTAYSEHSWEQIHGKLGGSDQLLVLKKPFDPIEVLQLATALTEKWHLQQLAKARVEDLQRQVIEHRENEERARRALAREHELHRIKSRFVTMVSHEFRTPLGVLNTAAHLLDRYIERMSAADRSAKIKEIQNAVDRMTGMMEDFLLHGELEAGCLEFRPASLDLKNLCRQIVSGLYHTRRPSAQIVTTIESGISDVSLDARLVRHILENVLSNAVKYSSEETRVLFDVRKAPSGSVPNIPARLNGEYLCFTVTDHGIGIPAEDVAALFQTFHRARNVGQTPGTGMGLAIVKQCVEAHCGQIQIESEEGRGTTVTIYLPIQLPLRTEGPVPDAGWN